MVNISFFDDLLDKYTINKSKKYSSQINIQKYAAMINITRQKYQGRKYKKNKQGKKGRRNYHLFNPMEIHSLACIPTIIPTFSS